MKNKITPTNHEFILPDDGFISSKTNTKGILTYANSLFIEHSGYKESELLGQQHNIIRHPDISRVIFKLLRETIVNSMVILKTWQKMVVIIGFSPMWLPAFLNAKEQRTAKENIRKLL